MEAEMETAINRSDALPAAQPDGQAETKRRLLLQGEYHRVGIVRAKAQLMQAARPEAIAHRLLDRAGLALRSGISWTDSLGALLPCALSGAAYLRRRGLVGKALVGGAVALAGLFYLRRQRH